MKATFQSRTLLPLVETARRIANVVHVRATADGIDMVADSTLCVCLFHIAKDAFVDYKCTEVSIVLELDVLGHVLQHLGPTLTIAMSDTHVTFESDGCCVEVQGLSHDHRVLNTVQQLSGRVYECVAHVPSKTLARVANLSGATVHVSCRGNTVEFTSKGPHSTLSVVLDSVVKPSDIDLYFSARHLLVGSKSVVLSMSPGSLRMECGCEGGHVTYYVSAETQD